MAYHLHLCSVATTRLKPFHHESTPIRPHPSPHPRPPSPAPHMRIELLLSLICWWCKKSSRSLLAMQLVVIGRHAGDRIASC